MSASLPAELAQVLIALLAINLRITLTAVAVALPIACLFALGRLSRHAVVRWPVTAYVNVLRSSPLLMVVFWAYYTGPMLTGSPASAETAATIALAAFEVAYFTEIIRAGVQSVSEGQRRAGLATGLRPGQVSRLIILPQALRRMAPSLLTQGLIAFQDSTIASVIGVSDALHTATIINARELRPVEIYTGLAAMYFLICFAVGRIVRAMEGRGAGHRRAAAVILR
jgi:His/Glu/Gln/Arg/opine family amino acid ABC transporter permease subunit